MKKIFSILLSALLVVTMVSGCSADTSTVQETIGGTRKITGITDSGYYEAVMKAEGNTLSEKTYNCLSDFGVPKAQLDSIIEILSEK